VTTKATDYLTLKLVSNTPNNNLPSVGKAELQDNFITITVESGTSASLLRNVNKVALLKEANKKQTVRGKILLGDVYILENNEDKLIIKVEEGEIKHEDNIFLNKDRNFDATSNFDITSTRRKTTLTVGVLILILLIISVVFGIGQKKKNEFTKISEEKLNLALLNYDKSVSENTIDRESSRELFVSAKEIAFELREDNYKSERLDKLILDITSKEAEVLGEVKAELKELLDLTLQTSGFNGDQIFSTGEEVFVFDKTNRNVIQLDTNGKNAKKVAGKDILEGAEQLASYGERIFSLNTDGVYEITNKREKISTSDDEKEKDWGSSYFYLYSGNIYLLDKSANMIYRFAGNNDSFSDKTEWLAPGIEVDFSKIIDISIDGSIWVLSSSGKVTKFTNGNPSVVLMKGIVEEVSNPTAIYTNEKIKNVYILDKETGRVIALEKNGNFKLQYKSDVIKEVKDLIVSEDESKIILLTGSKLMYIEL